MIKLFSGTANQPLAEKIAHHLSLPLSKAEIVRFDNSEVRVAVKENVKNTVSIVIQSTSNPTDTHLMELFFFADALRRGGTREIVAVIPYFGYARQNREHSPGEAVSVNVVARFLEAVGYQAVFTVNLHDEATEGIFSITFKNLSALKILSKKAREFLVKEGLDEKKFDQSVVVVSPDQGGIERAQDFSDSFFQGKIKEIAVVEKKRDLERIHQSIALNLFGDVTGKICLLVDDIITSGSTIVNAAKLCLQRGARKIFVVAIHHDFSARAKPILENSPIEKIFTTDTIFLKSEDKINKLIEVSVASLIAEEIKSRFIS